MIDPDDRLVGMLARVELLAVFLRGDAALQADLAAITTEVAPTDRVEVRVRGGVAELTGSVRLRSTAADLEREARLVPGLIGLENNLRYDIDDSLITGI